MRFCIHGHWPNGAEDSIVVEGDSVEELREVVAEEINRRAWHDCWSEELTD